MAMPADDRYDAYYAEKLWELIPPYYRDLDGEQQPPGPLRALVEVFAEQAATLRRSQDRVWEDQFIERCDAWAVPYIGDLLATRPVSALLPREQRIDVAKTIYYRRRAGTLRVLEELINDIADWEGVVREGFRRLARSPHGLDPAVPGREGRWTGTPPGGLADLRSPLGAELAGGPFEDLHHTPDLRRPAGRDGRYGIPRLAFHLYRAQSYRVEGVTPGQPALDFMTFDPSGREIPLFARRTRPQVLSSGAQTPLSAIFESFGRDSAWEEWTSARAWEVPAPIRCRLLGDVAYLLEPDRLAAIDALLGAAERAALRRLHGLRVRGESRLATLLAQSTPDLSPRLADIRRDTLAADCGKAVLFDALLGSIRLLPDGLVDLPVEALAADSLSPAAVTWASWQLAAVDAERGRFVLNPVVAATDPLTDYHYGFPGPIGAGAYGRGGIAFADPAWQPPTLVATLAGGGAVPAVGVATGTLRIDDNRSYDDPADNAGATELCIRSADGRRPFVRLGSDWVFTAAGAGNAILVLDGLWLGADGGTPRELVLQGDWERVELRCCTLDPGGSDAAGNPLGRIGLRVAGAVELLAIQSSIVSDIATDPGASLGRLELRDSIVQPSLPGGVLALGETQMTIDRTTVLGGVEGWRLWSSDSLYSGVVDIVDTQGGCFRFSAADAASIGHVPHPYESAFFADASALFVSRTFGHPGYASLTDAPEAALQASADDTDGLASIHTGASNDGEMGAFNALLNPLKLRALRAKVDEYMPFGLLPAFVNET